MRQKLILAFGCLILTALPFAGAHATTLTVDCDHPATATRLSSIGAALKLLGNPLGAALGPNTINVSGTCNENISLDHVTNLTLTAQNGASITDASAGTMPVISVTQTTNFALNGFAIRGGGGPFQTAILCVTNSTCYFSRNDVQYPGGSGIGAYLGSSVWLDHDVLENCATGMLVVDSSRAAITTATIRNNSGQGVWILGNSSLVVAFSTVIQNNGGAGVYALNHSFAQITATSITGNGGMGVFAQIASEVWFFPPGSTITGNGNGVAVQDLSWANFYGSQTTVSGSTAQPDIQCWGHFSGASSAADAGSTNCQP